MPVKGIAQVTAPSGNKEWTPVPEDVYQVVIADIIEKDGKKYQSDEDVVQYLFKLIILDEGEQQKQQVSAFCSTSWFGGSGGKKGYSPSKLVTIFKAIYGFYFPTISITDMEAEEANSLMVQNALIGAQLRITVKLNDDKTGNKVTEFMSIKKELPVPEDVKLEGEFKLKAEPAAASAVASTANSSNPDEFIASLEEDQKKESIAEELAA